MKHFLLIIFSILITDFYFFPIEFIFLPGINTKMVLAGISLIILGFNLARHRSGQIDKAFLWLSLSALCVSFVSYISIVVNNTPDHSFTGYIMSMWVWLGGAYTVIRTIKLVHGKVSIPIVCNYLISVCVMQCVLAYIMNMYTPMFTAVSSVLGGEKFMGITEGRLSGIGAALDVAGLRFSAVLVMIAYLMVNIRKVHLEKYFICYVVAFLIIGVIGNMIARTTTMGIVLSIAYWLYSCKTFSIKQLNWQFMASLAIVVVSIVGMIYLYNVDATFHNNIRFGFEGFFSLFEHGKWYVSSNDILLNHMIQFPETFHTWIIGDGYCSNPLAETGGDPYYTGPSYHGFYMGTDIGYIRFLFYFGIIGLAAFILFFLVCGKICMSKFSNFKMLFFLLLMVNFIGWFKVATDIFLVFAPFLCVSKEDNYSLNSNVDIQAYSTVSKKG